MRFKHQTGSALILILLLLIVMTESIFTVLSSLREQQIVIHAFKTGVQDKIIMSNALVHLEQRINPSSCRLKWCHMRYLNKSYEYSVESATPTIIRISIRDDNTLHMQSVLLAKSHMRQSWQ